MEETHAINSEKSEAAVINISRVKLAPEQCALLSKSLKFNATTDLTDFDWLNFQADIEMFLQKIRYKDYHHRTKCRNSLNTNDPPIVKNKSDKRTSTSNKEIIKLGEYIAEILKKRKK